MSLKFLCPECGAENFISQSAATGDETRCAVCGAQFAIPSDASIIDEHSYYNDKKNAASDASAQNQSAPVKKSAFERRGQTEGDNGVNKNAGGYGGRDDGRSLEPGAGSYYQNVPGGRDEPPHKKRQEPFLSKVMIVLIVLTFMIVPVLNKEGRQSMVKSRLKMCVSNMKTIEGAMELYLMENAAEKSRFPADFKIETLVQNGYLRNEIKCYEKGVYKITIRKINKSFISELSCSKHGKLVEQDRALNGL